MSEAAVSSTSRVEKWAKRLGESKSALWVLFWASVAETLIVPIPIELILIPYMLANRARIFLTASVVLAGNIAAALVGYTIGYFAFNSFGLSLIEQMGWGTAFAEFQTLFAQYGFWAVVAIGVIPIPFQIAMLVAGAAKYPIAMFVIASMVARGLRYYGIAALVYAVGDKAVDFWKRHKISASLGAGAVLLLVFLVSRYL